MPAAPRHAKPSKPVTKRGVPVAAAATLAGVAAAFVFVHGGSAAAGPSHAALPVQSATSGYTSDYVTADVRRTVIARMIRESAAAQRRHHAKLAAARRARRQTAQQPAAAPPSPAPTAAPAPSSGGGDAASSPLGVCIRNSEEGGSYAWGPGNGGGAYQFLLGTWEKYGGAASEYGVAGPAYQDQIFDNAIAAGGASNWTSYDGC